MPTNRISTSPKLKPFKLSNSTYSSHHALPVSLSAEAFISSLDSLSLPNHRNQIINSSIILNTNQISRAKKAGEDHQFDSSSVCSTRRLHTLDHAGARNAIKRIGDYQSKNIERHDAAKRTSTCIGADRFFEAV